MSATDGDAERLIKYLESSLPQIIYSVREDDSRLLMDYQADMMAEIIIGSIKALQSTRKPPVDTIAVPREVLQGVRATLKKAIELAHRDLTHISYDKYANGVSFDCIQALASLDAVLEEGKS